MRLPSPRHAVHRGLWIPGLREGDDSPCGSRSPTLLKKLTVPDGYRPSGSAIANRTPRPELDHNDASKVDRGAYQDPVTMSVLRRSNPRAVAWEFVTQ